MKHNIEKKIKKIELIPVVTGVIVVGTIILALYIMVHHLGLSDSLNFGAGAYYYADIPEFQKYVNGNAYHSETPMWVLILLFLIWGGIMYKLWSWI
ncbi:MAG: hypothetical protein ACI4TF_13035, partial [Oliverpabstia sp.]